MSGGEDRRSNFICASSSPCARSMWLVFWKDQQYWLGFQWNSKELNEYEICQSCSKQYWWKIGRPHTMYYMPRDGSVFFKAIKVLSWPCAQKFSTNKYNYKGLTVCVWSNTDGNGWPKHQVLSHQEMYTAFRSYRSLCPWNCAETNQLQRTPQTCLK
jgi:hypothetical protein